MKPLTSYKMIAAFLIITLLAPPLTVSSFAAEASGTWRGKWWNYYDRGLSYADKSDWNNALKDFSSAVDLRDKDQRRARTYGMHFSDYFAHRELGIAYFQTGDLPRALKELELSIAAVETDKGKMYLDRVRALLLSRAPDKRTLPPQITLNKPANNTLVKSRSILLSGKAGSEAFVSEISINGAPYPVEKSAKEVSFSRDVQLDDGSNPIRVEVKDLAGNSSEVTVTVIAKRDGPSITLSEVVQEDRSGKRFVKVTGDISDSAGIRRVLVGSQEVNPKNAKNYRFDIAVELSGNSPSYLVRAFDTLDNETVAPIDLSQIIRAEQHAAETASRQKAAAEQKAQQVEVDRLTALQQESQRLAKEKALADALLVKKTEAERVAREAAERARIAKENAEQQRLAVERAAAEQLAREKAENERLARVQAAQDRLARETAEKVRLAYEKSEMERLARERAEQERLAREKAGQERLAVEQAEQERLAQERIALEKLASEKAVAEQAAREKAEKDRQAREEANRIRIAAEKSEQKRLLAEKAAADKAAQELVQQQLVAQQKAEQERIAHQKAEADRLAHERVAQEQIAREKAELEKRQQEQVAAIQVERQKLKEILDEQKLSKALGSASDKQLELGAIISGEGTKAYVPPVPSSKTSSASTGSSDGGCGFFTSDHENPIITLKGLDAIPQVFVDSFPLDGEISDNCRVEKLKINGRDIAISKGKKIYFSKVIRIESGENTIKLEAFDGAGNKAQGTVIVTRKLPSVMQNGSRMSLVVLPFDFNRTAGSVTPLASDYLTGAMTEQKRFLIAERNKLKSVLEEQKFTQAVIEDNDRTAKLGKIMAAEAIIATNVRETENSLEVTSRVINTETSEVMDVLDAYTEDKSAPAVKELMAGLAAKIARVFPVTEGIVISHDDDQVMTDMGTRSHVKNRHGAIFYRKGKEILHPATGKSLGWDTIKLGEGYIEDVQEGFSKVRLGDRYRDSKINPSDLVITK